MATRQAQAFTALTLTLLLAGPTLAQRGPGSRRPGTAAPGGRGAEARGAGPRQAVDGRFEAAAPAVGEPMPALTLYDAEGEDVELRQLLHGHYTVMVLGCLT